MNKRLYKSSSDKVLFGVCGGIAEYFDVDSVVIRLLVVVFALTGAGILFYIFAAIIIRERPEERLKHGAAYDRSSADASYGPGDAETYSSGFYGEPARETENFDQSGAAPQERSREGGGKGSGLVIFGLILIIVGVFYFIDRFVPIFHWIDFRMILAVILVLLGIYFVAKR
jgi:phage shock protein PspC (stress-responsive transcriptional regulator)